MRCRATPISSATEMNIFLKTSRLIASTAIAYPSCVRRAKTSEPASHPWGSARVKYSVLMISRVKTSGI